MIGIYKIENITTKDIYIGSSINFKQRWLRHKRNLKKGNHHSIILQRAWDKYGESNFEFNIIQECNKENLAERENYYLLLEKPIYNICKFAYNTLGRVYTEETRKKHKKYAKENNIKPPKSTYEAKMKKVIMLNYNSLEEIKEFESVSEACRFLGKTHKSVSTITDCCKGRRNSAFKYKWKFKL